MSKLPETRMNVFSAAFDLGLVGAIFNLLQFQMIKSDSQKKHSVGNYKEIIQKQNQFKTMTLSHNISLLR